MYRKLFWELRKLFWVGLETFLGGNGGTWKLFWVG